MSGISFKCFIYQVKETTSCSECPATHVPHCSLPKISKRKRRYGSLVCPWARRETDTNTRIPRSSVSSPHYVQYKGTLVPPSLSRVASTVPSTLDTLLHSFPK